MKTFLIAIQRYCVNNPRTAFAGALCVVAFFKPEYAARILAIASAYGFYSASDARKDPK